jgi:ankyrin repeat protein
LTQFLSLSENVFLSFFLCSFFAKFLIEHGASLNPFNEDGETPLLIACGHGYVEFVRLLFQHSKVSSEKPRHKNKKIQLFLFEKEFECFCERTDKWKYVPAFGGNGKSRNDCSFDFGKIPGPRTSEEQ